MKRIVFLLTAIVLSARLSAQAMPTIDIVYDGDVAQITIPDNVKDITSTVSGAYVTLISSTTTTEYCYRVSGTSTNGRLYIQGNYKLTLQLDGLTLSNAVNDAVNINCGKRIAVVLTDGTINTLSDGLGAQKACMYFKGHPEFQGQGTLNVTGRTGHAISAKEYLEVKSGTINVLSAIKDGIHCGKGLQNSDNNYFEQKGGAVNIDHVGGDGIDSDDFGTVKIKDGELNITVREDGGRGIKCDSVMTVTGGDVNISLLGGTLITPAVDTTPADTSRCMALNVGEDFTMTAGNIHIDMVNDEAKAYKVKGTMNVDQQGMLSFSGHHFETSVADYRYDMQTYVSIVKDGTPITDYANYQVGLVYDNESRGQGEVIIAPGNNPFITMRLRSNALTNQYWIYVYDASSGRAYRATKAIAFKDNTTLGLPSKPEPYRIIHYDIDDNSQVDIADVATLVEILNKRRTDSKQVVDVNGDGLKDALDVESLCEKVKRK